MLYGSFSLYEIIPNKVSYQKPTIPFFTDSALKTQKGVTFFFSKIVKTLVFEPAYCGYWGSKQGKLRSSGCWVLAVCTSMALQRHFHKNSINNNNKKYFGASICIG